MDREISIPLALYNRLAQLAKGFDAPANVVERLLEFYEQHSGETIPPVEIRVPETPQELDLVLFPSDEEEFKRLLLVNKQAWIRIHYLDGTTKVKNWNIKEFGRTSNLRGNLFSGYLRGWKDKGIYKAEVAIDREKIGG